MGVACIIEQEAQTLKTLESTLKEVDPRLEILSFKDLEGFYKWFSTAINQPKSDNNQTSVSANTSAATVNSSASTNTKTKSVELKVLIGDIQFLGPNYFTLIEKLRKLMVRRGIIQNENQLAVLLTAFETPNLDIKQIESRIITNIVFKPFDMPILKQQLKIALSDQKPINDSQLFTQKLESTAEMLKEVQLESFTDLGFTTRSNRELKINDVSKYYSKYFEAKGKQSVLARCISCVPHPQFAGEYLTEFRYFGANNNQVRQLRQTLFTIQHGDNEASGVTKKTFPRSVKKSKAEGGQLINTLIFLKSGTDPGVELKDVFEQGLSNVTMTINRNMALFVETLEKNDVSPLGSKPIHCIIMSSDSLLGQGFAAWSQILIKVTEYNEKQFSLGEKAKPKLIITSHHEIPEDKLRVWSKIISEVIYAPSDRPYLFKRLITLFPEVQPRLEAVEILTTNTNEVIRVANPIEVTSISEAMVTIKYYRAISFHSFRRFCLPSVKEGEEKLEILASCFYSEKKGDDFINHFVFFGITDKYLKNIRKWILERYIASKDANSKKSVA